MINHKIKLLSMALLLLSGCSGSGGSTTTSAAPASAEEAITLENPVRLDQLGVLPASDSSAASYLLQLTNYSKDKYTLVSARAVDLTTGKDSTLVSVASQACNILSANGSCSIQLTPHTSQSADVKLEVTLKDQNGASRTLFQLIRISGALNANSGGIVMINDVDRIVTEDGNYSLSIPVVLGESYDDIKASNGSLLCNTTGYLKGSSCTYQVRGKVTGDGAVVSTRLEGIKADKTVAVEEASTRIEVAMGAHLLMSHGIKIYHPESSAEITIFNSGNSTAKDIATSVGNSSDLEIDTTSNTCKANLEANAACKVKVKVKSSVSINGQAPVSVNYKDGITGLTTLTNIRYKVAAAAAGIEFSESSNTLSNAIVNGKERSVIINIKNTGNRDLSNISYYLAPIGSEGLTLEKGTTNSCGLSDANLAVNASCSLIVKYKPTAAQSKSTINLVINGKHNDEHGLAHSLINSLGLNYSATEASAGNLVWTTTSNKDILSIKSNNNDSESTIWKLSNTLAADENLPASNVNVSLNPATINGLKVTPVDTAKCTLNADIAGNNACEYNVIYGPVSADQDEIKVKLKADYTLDNKTLTSETSEFKVKADSVKAPKITVSVKIPENTTSSGDGTTQAPWSFTAYSDKLLKLTYTFKNEGNLAAESFNVGANNLPSGAIVDSATTCKTGTETIRLEANNASCDLVVTIPDPELFSTPNSPLLINLNSASLKLDLPYSYYDNGSLKRGSSGTKHVNFNRLWANVEHVLGGSQEDNSNYTVLVKSSAKIINNSGATYPLTIKPFLKNPIAGVFLSECIIVNKESEACVNEINLPKVMFKPGTPVIVTFKTSATGMKDSDAILSSVDAKAMAGNHVYTEDDLIYALNHQQANSTITLESDIALRKPWKPIENLSQITFDGNGHKITGLKVNNKSDQNVGMFKFLLGPLTIKNLSLEGVVKSDVGNAGLIGGYLDGSNISILNSHFKSNVSANSLAGGLIGIMAGNANTNIKFESVTVDAIVTSTGESGAAGGLTSSVYSSTKFENIRINANIVGFNRLGGLAGFHGWKPIEVKNIIATAVIQANQSAKSDIGGLLGHSNNQRLIGDRIDVFVNVTANNSTSIGGVVGQVNYFNSSLSNILVRGSIKTTRDPSERKNYTAGLVTASDKEISIKNAVDKVTITHGDKNYSSSLVTSDSAVKFASDSANIFYALPSEVELLTLLSNPGLVNPLSGTTAQDERDFLIKNGFDFTNTWTIKKVNGVDSIGIKEDSIPQFPKW